MAATATGYEHVVLSEDGVPEVAGTSMKVVELVADRMAHGWSPEELQFQHPHLTLGQVYSALAYYADHAAEIEADLARRLDTVDQLGGALVSSPLVARLRAAARSRDHM